MKTITEQMVLTPGRIVAYLDSFPLSRVFRDRQARLASVACPTLLVGRQLQSATGEELRPFFGRTLLPSVLACTAFFSDRAFKGEL